jgi:hypothetical protein
MLSGRFLLFMVCATLFEAYVSGDTKSETSASPRYVVYGGLLCAFVVAKSTFLWHSWFFIRLLFTTTYRYPPQKPSHQKPEITECAICITDFEKGDIVTRLRCAHTFHATCISKWCYLRESRQDLLRCCSCRLSISPFAVA